MLRVTVELLPGGHEANREVLGVIEIWNDGTSQHPSKGNYGARSYVKNTRRVARYDPQVIVGYPRLSLSVWCLVRRALGNLGYL